MNQKKLHQFNTRRKSLLSTVLVAGIMFAGLSSRAQTVISGYSINPFASGLSSGVYEMTQDAVTGNVYYAGGDVNGIMYKITPSGTATSVASGWALAAGSWLPYMRTGIAYYNGSVYSFTPNNTGMSTTNLGIVGVDATSGVSSVVTTSAIDGSEDGNVVVGNVMYMTDGSGTANTLYKYDFSTLTFSNIGTGTLPTASYEALSYCSGNNKMYLGNSNGNLYTVNLTTGVTTLVCSTLATGNAHFAVDPYGTYAYYATGSGVNRIDLSTGVSSTFASSVSCTDVMIGTSSSGTATSLYIGGGSTIYEVQIGLLPGLVTLNGGGAQDLAVCESSGNTSINLLLTATALTGSTFTWTVTSAPSNGTLHGFAATKASGSGISPTGTSYSPTAGFSGTDAFTIQVSNGTTTSSTTISVTVNPLPVAGTITGTFSVAVGGTTSLADAAPGGVWSGCNNSVATVDASGVVTGISIGNALISYTVTNGCGVRHALASVIVGSCAAATNIKTIGGNHTKGYSGDGGAASAAQMGTPYAVAADATGNVYVADFVNNVIRKINTAGTITTVAGTGVAGFSGDNGPATSAQLNGPAGVTVDGYGNIYIADYTNERIRKVDASGTITTIAGNGFHGGWQGHSQGNGGLATNASLDYPMSIALDCAGNIYFSEYGSQMVRKINAAGRISIFAGTGAGGYNGDGIAATSAKLDHPHGLAIDGVGNVYIADCWNNRIRKVNSAGIIKTYAGNGAPSYSGDGGPATSASIWIPWGITFNACGDLYICDYNNNAVRMVTSTGTMSTFAGNHLRGYTGDGGAATAARVYLPSSLAIDGLGNIFIADYGNYVVRLMGSTSYSARTFASGTTQIINACEGTAVNLNDNMAIPDAADGKTETWTISATPQHGTLSGFNATAVSKDGMTTPTGLSYMAEAGFTGEDEFTVQMNDGTTAASTTITVVVNPLPNVGTIVVGTTTGKGTATLSDPTADLNGIWSSSDNDIATVDANGNVTGVTNGTATISYTLTNGCGSKSATTTIVSDVNAVAPSKLVLFPNPTSGTFNCEFSSDNDAELELTATDVTGRVVYKQPVTATSGINRVTVTLPATLVRPAMYLITLGSKDSKYKSMKITLSE